MYYELYIDVLFLVNFMMDYLVLLIARKILKCSATHRNICAGSFAGSLLTCIVIVIPIPYAFIKFILFHVIVNTLMIKVGLKIKIGKPFLKALVTLYVSSFLLGGVFQYLQQYVRIGSLFFALAIVSYYLVQGIWSFITYLQKIDTSRCKVTLYVNGISHTVNALIDTGNSLQDSVTGKPVCIIDKQTARIVLKDYDLYHMRYLPFHTIGQKTGIIPVFKLEKMCVYRTEECWVIEPIIGVSEHSISEKGEYQMILNPNIL